MYIYFFGNSLRKNVLSVSTYIYFFLFWCYVSYLSGTSRTYVNPVVPKVRGSNINSNRYIPWSLVGFMRQLSLTIGIIFLCITFDDISPIKDSYWKYPSQGRAGFTYAFNRNVRELVTWNKTLTATEHVLHLLYYKFLSW